MIFLLYSKTLIIILVVFRYIKYRYISSFQAPDANADIYEADQI